MKKLLVIILSLALTGCFTTNQKNLDIGVQSTAYKLGSGDTIDFTAITKSNDGAGSGLDGDLLDGVSSASFSQLGASIESAEIANGEIVDADVNASAAIAATKIAFADTDSNFTATTIGAALEELDDTNGSGPNAADGKVDWTQIEAMPAGFADGTDDTGGTAASTSTDVSSSASTAGVVSEYSREDHTHRGVASFRKAGDTLLYGAVTLTGGTNITLTQVGQDVEIISTASASDPDEAYVSILASDIEISNDNTQTHFTLRNKMVDTIRDSSGIDAGNSSDYTVQGASDYDVVVDSNGIAENFESSTSRVWTLIGDLSGTEWQAAMKFQKTGASTYSVTGVEFELDANTGSPSGAITVRIETDSSAKPSGTLAHANATATVSSPTASAWNTCSMTSFTLNEGTDYWIVLSTVAQATNSRYLWMDNSSGYTRGGTSRKAGAGAWEAEQTTNDANFRINTTGASSAIVEWNAFTSSSAPTSFIIHANTTGTAPTWDISRNGGTNFQTGVAINEVVTFTSTSGSSVKLRANLGAADSEVDDVAVQVIP